MASPRGNNQYTHGALDFLKGKAHVAKAGVNSIYISQQVNNNNKKTTEKTPKNKPSNLTR